MCADLLLPWRAKDSTEIFFFGGGGVFVGEGGGGIPRQNPSLSRQFFVKILPKNPIFF